MKILVVSDTHKSIDLAEEALKSQSRANLLIHLGDYVEDGIDLADRLGLELLHVRGDNDFLAGINDCEVEISGCKIFFTHGHHHEVDEGLDDLAAEAQGRQVHLALFGHTHRPEIIMRDGLCLLNPGSFCPGEKVQSFGVIEIKKSKLSVGIYNCNQGRLRDV